MCLAHKSENAYKISLEIKILYAEQRKEDHLHGLWKTYLLQFAKVKHNNPTEQENKSRDRSICWAGVLVVEGKKIFNCILCNSKEEFHRNSPSNSCPT